MKQKLSLALALALTLSLAACGNQAGGGSTPPAGNPPSTPPASSDVTPEPSETAGTPDNTPAAAGDSGILIAYFGVPETDGTDTVANASRVATENGVAGNCQFIAQAIQQAVGGDLFAIETVQQYPGAPTSRCWTSPMRSCGRTPARSCPVRLKTWTTTT